MPDGIGVTIKRVVLEFILGQGETVRSSERKGAKSPLIQSNAAFSVHRTGPARPSWLVAANEGEDIGSVFDLPNDFIKVKGVAPGDIIRAYLGGDGPHIEIALTFAFPTERPPTGLEKKVAALLKRYEILSDERQQLAAGMIAVKAKTRHFEPPE
jgi:hypothetical protein